jgi:hypothetical protein
MQASAALDSPKGPDNFLDSPSQTGGQFDRGTVFRISRQGEVEVLCNFKGKGERTAGRVAELGSLGLAN